MEPWPNMCFCCERLSLHFYAFSALKMLVGQQGGASGL